MRQTKKPEDFEKFYYRYVGKGEGCGCAEKIIDVHEFNRLAGPLIRPLRKRWTLPKALGRLLRRNP
jgi:hypothetical protein